MFKKCSYHFHQGKQVFSCAKRSLHMKQTLKNPMSFDINAVRSGGGIVVYAWLPIKGLLVL